MKSKHLDIPRRSRVRQLLRRAISFALLGISSAFLIVVSCPQLRVSTVLSTFFPFAHILAFPYVLGAILLMSTLVAAVICWRRRCHWLGWVHCAMWLAVSVSLLLIPYGVPKTVITSTALAQRSLTVVTFNTGSTLTSQDLEKLVTLSNPDIIVLPETSAYDARRAIETAYYQGHVFEPSNGGFSDIYEGQIAPTTVIINKKLGSVKTVPGPSTAFGTVALAFDDPVLPVIVGIHAAPPLPGLMRQWREDLDRVTQFGESSTKPMVIAGDFNATLRHSKLASRSRLIDSQEFCGWVQVGTWPAKIPRVLRSPIDHVLVTAPITATSCQTVPIGESDHLAYITTLNIK